ALYGLHQAPRAWYETLATYLLEGKDVDVHTYRCDNRTEFKNVDLNQFCGLKGIKREFRVPRTPPQNGIAERKNRTLIEAARTLLADSLLPIPFWAEAVNTASYVDEGFLVGYSVCSKEFRVFNSRTRIIHETLHVNFMENKPNVVGSGPAWLFDIDSLSQTMNYHPVLVKNQTNSHAGFQDTKKAGEEGTQTYSMSPDIHSLSCGDQTREQGDKAENKDKGDKAENKDKGKSPVVTITRFRDLNEEFEEYINNSSNEVNAAGSLISAAELNFTNSTNVFSAAGPSNAVVPNLEDLSHNADDVGAEADINNMVSIISVSLFQQPKSTKIIQPLKLLVICPTTQTRSMARGVRDQGGISQMFNEDCHTYMFACFLSQEEPKRVHQALKDPSWIEAMQEELIQFKMQKV
nr:hypothetical protein [Tanacetum cinerariifolium]